MNTNQDKRSRALQCITFMNSNIQLRTGTIILVFFIVCALLVPIVSSYSFYKNDLDLGPVSPNAAHLFGTDDLGRDMLVRCMWGLRISLLIGICATSVSLFIGVIYGAIAGYAGGRADMLMMRIVDMLYAYPFIFFVIILMVVFGKNIFLLFAALGAVQWLTISRIVRGQVLSLKNRDFIKAARISGCSTLKIIFLHLIPNCFGPIIVYTAMTVPTVIMEESFLSFLGLGVQAPMASLGSLISDGVEYMETGAWILFFPGAILCLVLFSLNFIAEGLRQKIDPAR
ncbi:MAG: peptide ABC transporter permease [Nitrospira bacterium SG8_35_4]|nr:MAG: peptide ABC transporter permease [Nitrospira bacterium SG8_35_4]